MHLGSLGNISPPLVPPQFYLNVLEPEDKSVKFTTPTLHQSNHKRNKGGKGKVVIIQPKKKILAISSITCHEIIVRKSEGEREN